MSRLGRRRCLQQLEKMMVLLRRSTLENTSCSPGFSKVTWRVLSHRYAVSRHETTCSCFHRRRTRWRAFLRSFRHLRFLPCGKTRMAIGTLAGGNCGVVHDVKNDATNCATHHEWKWLFVKISASWFLDSTYFIWIFTSKYILQITSPEQLEGCGTRVSSSDFRLWWSSLTQLRCLRKCTTVIPSQRDDVRSKELDLRSIDPHSDPTPV